MERVIKILKSNEKNEMLSLPKEKEYLVTDNLKLVQYVIHQMHLREYTDYDELYQEGCIGLIKAAINFDDKAGTKFSTFAFKYIRGFILSYLERRNWLAPPGSSLHKYMPEYLKNREDLNSNELQELLNVSDKQLKMLYLVTNIVSLNTPINEEGDELLNFIKDDCNIEFECEDRLDIDNFLNESLEEFISRKRRSQLSEATKSVVKAFTNDLLTGNYHTIVQFAKKYSVTRQHVSKILIDYKKYLAKRYARCFPDRMRLIRMKRE